jgi:hypothetical protein
VAPGCPAATPTHWRAVYHFFFLFPLFEEQKLHTDNSRMGPESPWAVLDPPKFVDAEPLTGTYLQPRLLILENTKANNNPFR